MGAVTVRLTEELQAFVDDEVRNGAYPSAEAYIQSLLAEEHACRSADLDEIADFTIRTWGEQAADDYVEGLLTLFGDTARTAHAPSLDHGGLKRLT